MKKFVYNLIFYFVHMSVLLVCVSVSYMHAVFMGAREGFRSLGAGVTDSETPDITSIGSSSSCPS